ncbi:MAG: integrase arm-type DNA-binding domain-containing protein [Fimbriimonadaceae bacterium]|nr:integrase arm-type DNA-binding domain-containing protein [Alphaproteobacteria bacterium]
MARARNKLTDVGCKAATKSGRLGDGGGLYLHVKPSGAKSWAFIWKKDKRRHEMGLGPYPAVRLSQARSLADQYRRIVAEGGNPIAESRSSEVPSFGACANEFLASMENQWRNEKHCAQWRMTLERYAAPIRSKKVSDTDTDDVLKVLTPLWQTRQETASRLRGRIERVLDYARVRGWREGENPALWRGHLKSILPARQKLSRGHHAAMPYAEVPGFVQALSQRDALSARALEFLILTAARSGEVLGATWSEFDAGIWTIPASRMKAGKEHRVPLSPRAQGIIDSLFEVRIGEHVFFGQKPGKPLSGMAFAMLMRRMGVAAYTPHGFRSTFRDWAGDATSFPREIAEQALAHTVGDATERAYRRSDALEKRRALMAAWADYCLKEDNSSVVRLKAI